MVSADVIPIKKLFREPDLQLFRLSPDATRMLGDVIKDKAKTLELIDFETLRSTDIFGFSYGVHGRFEEYGWVDNDTVYVESVSVTGGRNRFLIELNGRMGIDFTVPMQRLTGRFEVVDLLDNENDRLLVSRTIRANGNKVKLYTISTQDLLDRNFSQAENFKHPLSNAIAYISDAGRVRMAFTHKKDTLLYHYLNSNNKWKEFHTFDNAKATFISVGFIDDDTIAVLSNEATDKISLVEYSLANSAFRNVLFRHATYDLMGAELDDGKLKNPVIPVMRKDIFVWQKLYERVTMPLRIPRWRCNFTIRR